jgi:hypothetical protein
MGRVFVLAVDASKSAHKAAQWCCNALVQPADNVHLLVITTSGAFGSSITPLASAKPNREVSLEAIANTKAVHEVLHLANRRVSGVGETVFVWTCFLSPALSRQPALHSSSGSLPACICAFLSAAQAN